MTYFSKFPKYYYPFNPDDTNAKTVATDIIHRIIVNEKLATDSSYYYLYTVTDGEKIEDIANKIYGRADYHWIIMLVNQIINPYYDWPLASDKMENYLNSKYPGHSLLLEYNTVVVTLNNVVGTFDTSNALSGNINSGTAESAYWDSSNSQIYINDVSGTFEIGEKVTQSLSNANGVIVSAAYQMGWDYTNSASIIQPSTGATATIQGFDSNIQKLIIKKTNSTDFDSTAGPIFEVDSNVRALIAANADFNVVKNLYAVHHYTNSNDDIVPRRYEQIIVAGSETFDYGTYDKEQLSGAGPVTNFDYEVELNESKRQIKILRPEFASIFVSEFEKLIQQTSVLKK